MKDPIKLAVKELTRYGAVIIHEDSRSIAFGMPQGGRYWVNAGTPLHNLRDVIETTRAFVNPLRGYSRAESVSLASDRVVVSRHFLDRFELMAGQEQLTNDEIRAALEKPAAVWRSDRRFAYEKGRVIVIVEIVGMTAKLVTPLWASEELWARNPRPEKEASC